MNQKLEDLIEFYYKKSFIISALAVVIFIVVGNITGLYIERYNIISGIHLEQDNVVLGIYIEKYNLAATIINLSLTLFVFPSFFLFGYKRYVENNERLAEIRDTKNYNITIWSIDYEDKRRANLQVSLELNYYVFMLFYKVYVFVLFVKAFLAFIVITS